MFLYYNGPASNHGCEAIVRATQKLLGGSLKLASLSPDQEVLYGLDRIVSIIDDRARPLVKPSLKWAVHAVYRKLTHSDELYTNFAHSQFFAEIKKNDVCLSVGGDNYCYPHTDILSHYNRAIHSRGAKTVLWGCSVEPELLKDPAMDLKLYLSRITLLVKIMLFL